ncbi:hypothetical protein [Alkalihalobacillus pseudalcaliphilus]|uniref:hypothetical protein n=1 Tax=Alkalihalobacillus pseudalcaliphilus TaxID=79884 RepID=UPI000B168631|nr:hypothetical protein [Alkalihalobacillus pseudalcaliphilus]
MKKYFYLLGSVLIISNLIWQLDVKADETDLELIFTDYEYEEITRDTKDLEYGNQK